MNLKILNIMLNIDIALISKIGTTSPPISAANLHLSFLPNEFSVFVSATSRIDFTYQ